MSYKIKEIAKKCLPNTVLAVLRFLRSIVLFVKDYKETASPGTFRDNYSRWIYLLFKGKADLIYQAYFNTAFDWGKIDNSIVDELRRVSLEEEAGCLLDASNDLRVRTQVNFLASILKKTKAKKILETGTHRAMFCYIAYLCDNKIAIDTFGNLAGSQIGVDILNQKHGFYSYYHLGDSKQTLTNFYPDYQIDFAWIDGGHSFEDCTSDLVNCARLGIPSIAVDDYKWANSINKAVNNFTEKYTYKIASISNLADYRGIVLLVRTK